MKLLFLNYLVDYSYSFQGFLIFFLWSGRGKEEFEAGRGGGGRFVIENPRPGGEGAVNPKRLHTGATESFTANTFILQY